MELSGQFHAPAALHPRERVSHTPRMKGWVGFRVDQVMIAKRKSSHNFLCWESIPGRPARSLVSVLIELSLLSVILVLVTCLGFHNIKEFFH
jgi:hypothetical protein